jgi:hypothetical protein
MSRNETGVAVRDRRAGVKTRRDAGLRGARPLPFPRRMNYAITSRCTP